MFRSYKDVVLINKEPKPMLAVESYSYLCNICDEDCPGEVELEVHRRSYHKAVLSKLVTAEFACRVCFIKFENELELVTHTKTQHLLSSKDSNQVEHEIFVCHHCCQVFFNKKLLTIHISRLHMQELTSNSLVECPVCCKRIKMGNVWYHLNQHCYQNFTCCPICLVLCQDRKDLNENHLKIHNNHYICSTCGLVFNKETFYKKHIQIHVKSATNSQMKISNEFSEYYVKKKGNSFSQFRSVFRQAMLNGYILPDNLKICILCKEICTNKQMAHHILHDHKADDKCIQNKHLCTICGEEFSTKVLLKYHNLKNHNTVKDRDGS